MIQALLLSALLTQSPARLAAPALTGQEAPQEPEARPLLRFRARRLQDGLGLSQAQAESIARRWAQFDQEHFQRQRQVADLRLRFNDILVGPETEDRKSVLIKPLLDQFVNLRHQQEDAKRQFEDDIRANLTPAQQARLVMLMEDLNKQVLKALQERRQERRGD